MSRVLECLGGLQYCPVGVGGPAITAQDGREMSRVLECNRGLRYRPLGIGGPAVTAEDGREMSRVLVCLGGLYSCTGYDLFYLG